MSFASRHSPRFSYASTPAHCPTAFLGQSTFWQEDEDDNSMSHGCTGRPPKAYLSAVPPQSAMMMAASRRGFFNEDEKRLITILGAGIIVALLIDAASHSGR